MKFFCTTAELFRRASVLINATAFLWCPHFVEPINPAISVQGWWVFCCLKFKLFKIMMLEALFFNDGDKMAAASKRERHLSWFHWMRLNRIWLFWRCNRTNKSFMGNKSMAAVNVLALVVTLFGQWRYLKTAASMGVTSTQWANHHFSSSPHFC